MKIYLGEIFKGGKYGDCVGEIVSEDLKLVNEWGKERKYNYKGVYGESVNPDYMEFRIRVWENGEIIDIIEPF